MAISRNLTRNWIPGPKELKAFKVPLSTVRIRFQDSNVQHHSEVRACVSRSYLRLWPKLSKPASNTASLTDKRLSNVFTNFVKRKFWSRRIWASTVLNFQRFECQQGIAGRKNRLGLSVQMLKLAEMTSFGIRTVSALKAELQKGLQSIQVEQSNWCADLKWTRMHSSRPTRMVQICKRLWPVNRHATTAPVKSTDNAVPAVVWSKRFAARSVCLFSEWIIKLSLNYSTVYLLLASC